MEKTQSNPCIRCGKQRITLSTKKERVGTSIIITTVTGCPDKKCQAIVDKQLKKEAEARRQIMSVKKEPFYPKRNKNNSSNL